MFGIRIEKKITGINILFCGPRLDDFQNFKEVGKDISLVERAPLAFLKTFFKLSN